MRKIERYNCNLLFVQGKLNVVPGNSFLLFGTRKIDCGFSDILSGRRQIECGKNKIKNVKNGLLSDKKD